MLSSSQPWSLAKIFQFPSLTSQSIVRCRLKFVRVVTFFSELSFDFLIPSRPLFDPRPQHTIPHLFLNCVFVSSSHFAHFLCFPSSALHTPLESWIEFDFSGWCGGGRRHETKRQDDRENLWSTVVRCEAKIDPQAAARHECGKRDDSTRWKIFFPLVEILLLRSLCVVCSQVDFDFS